MECRFLGLTQTYCIRVLQVLPRDPEAVGSQHTVVLCVVANPGATCS